MTVQPPAPDGQVQQRCDHLGNQLPAKLDGLRSRVVNPRSPLTHAWGSPAVVLRCGVAAPHGFDASSSATTAVNGVRWFQTIGSGDAGAGTVVWTAIRPGPTTGTSVFVDLAVPTSYPASDGFLTGLAPALKRALP